jgi:hypothetical protein
MEGGAAGHNFERDSRTMLARFGFIRVSGFRGENIPCFISLICIFLSTIDNT